MTLKLTNRELDVMSVVWARGSATVAEVQSALDDELAYTTVLTVLRGLEAKGAVRYEREGKAHRYYPRIHPAKVGDRWIGRLVDKVYLGSRELLITRLVADEHLSPEELKRIRRTVDRRLKEIDG